MSRTRFQAVGYLPLAAALWGCGRETAATPAEPAALRADSAARWPSVAPASAQSASRYPQGKWRGATPEQLEHTVLWLSDIAIRHAEMPTEAVSFHLNGWASAAPRASRTRQQALELAEHIVALARGGASFEQLARQFSDEPETAARGGSLGGLIAGTLSPWPEALDAVETLKPGDVSNPVETETGFHVLYRRAPVAEGTVSGRHIVLAHDGAPFLRVAARGPLPQRSRLEALALAKRIYEQAHARPAQFERLVAEYSEHRDAMRGGDFGTWSTREPTGYPREIETLEGLAPGEVAEPIDSVFGIQIIQRVVDPPRERYAMTAIEFFFDPKRAEAEPGSQQAALRQAEEVSKILRDQPERFDSLQAGACCRGTVEVITGRESPAVEAALGRLSPGQVWVDPILDLTFQYLLLKRLERSTLAEAPEARFELPTPTAGGG